MRPIDKTAATATVLAKLKPQFGNLVQEHETGGSVIVDFPGHDFPVRVHTFSSTPGSVLRVCRAVCEVADWSGGLANFLLLESSKLLVGSITRRGEGIVVEQIVVGNAASPELAAVVFTVADLAAGLRRDLAMMGALTVTKASPGHGPGT